MIPPSPFRYWAFISYSHHDERVAKQLVQRLGRAVVPKAHRKRVDGAAARFEPIFVDTDEAAAASELDDELRAPMRESAKLIVLCSPFSALSRHVADEIRYMQDIGRAGDILCLIVSGVPGAAARGTPALECFPDPLWKPDSQGRTPPEPLAATLGKETEAEWRHAIDQLTAGMLGEPLQHRRTWLVRRRRRIWTAWVGGFATWAAIAYGVAWALWLPQHLYAKDGVRRWGAWEPIGPVTAQDASHRPQTLKFERRGRFGPWAVVRWVDGFGECAGDGPRSIVGDAFEFQCTRSKACGVRLGYSDGKLTGEQVFDQFEQPIETLNYSVPQLAVLNEAVIGCSRRAGDIEFVALERQPDGPLAGVDRGLRFRGGDDKAPHPNSFYAFGLTAEFDAKGHVTQRAILDPQNAPRLGSTGYAAIRYRYNDAGDQVGQTTLGLDGQPVEGRGGYATLEREVDAYGRALVERFLDAKGRPGRNRSGVHSVQFQWNDQGQVVESAFRGIDGRPTVDGNGVATVRHRYENARGTDRESYFDAQGRPTLHAQSGCAAAESREPSAQLWREDRCFGIDGKPVISKAGWHLKRTTYSSSGQESGEAYFDVHERPTTCTDKSNACPFHRVENHFDERGNRVQARFFGVNGEPVLAGTGVAGARLVYNARNRQQRWINVGLDGQAAPDRDGVVATESLYDDYGRVIEKRNVDATGKPMPLATALLGIRFEYDGFGNQVKVEHFDVSLRPTIDKSGEAITRYRFDVRGRVIEERSFDASDTPTLDDNRRYGSRYVLDDWGRIVTATRLGPDGRPQAGDDGVLSRRIDHDIRGHRVRLQLLDATGRPATRKDGVSAWVEEVDDAGRTLSQRRVGLLGQPVADSDGVAGYRARFDGRGNLVRYVRIGADGLPVESKEDGIAILISDYDERDRIKTKFFFDAKASPKSNPEGIFGLRLKYDERDQQVEERYLAADGSLHANHEGTARMESDFDAAGGITESRSFDAGGAPVSGAVAPIVRHRNDGFGRELERSYFDSSGRPMSSPGSGRSKTVLERDSFGRLIRERSFGVDGQPVDRLDTGWSYRTLRYDDIGELAEVQCFDRAGVRVAKCEKRL